MGQFSIVNSFITVISPLEPWAPTVVTTIFIFRFGFYFARHHEYESPLGKYWSQNVSKQELYPIHVHRNMTKRNLKFGLNVFE